MRWLYRAALAILVVIAIVFVAQKLFGSEATTPHLVSSRPVAAIGSGEDVVAVADDGTVLAWLSLGEDVHLPELPLSSPPEGRRVQGPVLEQVRVLAAVPPALRPYVARSYFGESGVNVELTSGIELRFGHSAGAERKWRAAATVLADPSITALDYVALYAPGRVTVGGSGHTLPPLP